MKWILPIVVMLCGPAFALDVRVEPRFAGEPLVYDAVTNLTASGQQISVTRLDFLLSGFAVKHNGIWTEQSNEVAYISAREGRTGFTLENIEPGEFERIRFHVGLNPLLNHGDPSQHAPDHPLNPQVNGLHWGWMGGYVFLALEGRWGESGGYSYHVATDDQLMRVELDLPSSNMLLVLNVDKILTQRIDGYSSSTHSRSNDVLATELRGRVERAFEAEPLTGTSDAANDDQSRPVSYYRFAYSRFFPQPNLPKDNPLTEEGVALGERLFFDRRLSVNGSQSCATCHQPELAFAEKRPVSEGAEGQRGTRNAMPLFNLAWKSSFSWDGRAATLRDQIRRPIESPVEMHESVSNVAAKLAATGEYPGITEEGVLRALEQFLLTKVASASKFDRVIAGSDSFTPDEQRGFELFHTEYDPLHGQTGADCFHCHGGPLLQSQAFGNNGLDAEPADSGRFGVTGREGDRGKFAVPSLRNVALTGPYMHDGRFATLEEVVNHYATGVKRSATLDPNLAKHPDGGVPLGQEDIKALVAFLETLTEQ